MENNERLSIVRHSTAHVMAEAVLKLFPGSKIAIGPSIDTGFYYDFDLSRPIKEDDLAEIEKEMRRIVSGNHDFIRKEVSKEEALSLFTANLFKELIMFFRFNTFTQRRKSHASCSVHYIVHQNACL